MNLGSTPKRLKKKHVVPFSRNSAWLCRFRWWSTCLLTIFFLASLCAASHYWWSSQKCWFHHVEGFVQDVEDEDVSTFAKYVDQFLLIHHKCSLSFGSSLSFNLSRWSTGMYGVFHSSWFHDSSCGYGLIPHRSSFSWSCMKSESLQAHLYYIHSCFVGRPSLCMICQFRLNGPDTSPIRSSIRAAETELLDIGHLYTSDRE